MQSTQVVEGTAATDKTAANYKLGGTDADGSQVSSFSSSSSTAPSTSVEARSDQLDQEQLQIRDLAARDREVRTHEAAHAAAGGAHTGSPSYSYTRGPDGRLYATEGEVSVDTSEVPGDPEATIAKAESIIRAALAPANPSPEDIKIAAQAQALLVNAQAELATQSGGSQVQVAAKTDQSSELTSDQRQETQQSAQATDSQSDDEEESNPFDQYVSRLERVKAQQQEFADQLQELNSKVNKVLQQLIESGATTGIEPQGTFVDLEV